MINSILKQGFWFVALIVLFFVSSSTAWSSVKGFSNSIQAILEKPVSNRKQAVEGLLAKHAIPCDWVCQDMGMDIVDFLNASDPEKLLVAATSRVLKELESRPQDLAEMRQRLDSSRGDISALLDLYVTACEHRREMRLSELRGGNPKIVFIKNIEQGNAPRGPLSLSNNLRQGKPFAPGASICVLDLSDDLYGQIETVLQDGRGMLRDPDVSFDGKSLLFSWKKSALKDDFHLYEMTIANGHIRQITNEPGVADIQGRYLPEGIVYHSSRCINVVVCNETIDTVNLYACDRNGRNIRRLAYDQVSTQFPVVMQDGRILYTRWEYNDRGQIFPQGLFVMNPDGTGQMAVYGNNSWYPTSLIQARDIPQSHQLVAVLSGHHSPPCGKLALIDLNRGQDEGHGISLIAPPRPIRYERVDAAGQDDVLFQYPYPLHEDAFLVGFSLFGRKKSRHFGIYYMHSSGARELLAWDPDMDCRQPMPLSPRPIPQRRPRMVTSDPDRGVFYMDNIYKGPGLRGIQPGTIKRLRVIALDFRAAAIGISFNNGPAGNARLDTPISIGGAWDVKTVLGDAEVYADGSASFVVPARTPVYFQAIDAQGRAVQSMRSWSTLQPGEKFSCIGCHETRTRTPGSLRPKTVAQTRGPQELIPFYGPTRGFSFIKEIQPILDRHCVSCHGDRPYQAPVMTKKNEVAGDLYCFWPAQYCRTNRKEALFHLPREQMVSRVSIRWFTEGLPGLREPERWSISYRHHKTWRRVEGQENSGNILFSPPVSMDTLRMEAIMPAKTSGGIATWRVFDAEGREVLEGTQADDLNLTNQKVYEDLSARAWSQSYLSLLRVSFRKQGKLGYHLTAYPNTLTHWISPQSGPEILEPYSFGAAKSELIAMLEAGHEDVTLTREEMDKLTCWIDLAVPYCGDYEESNLWTAENTRFYHAQLAERRRLSRLERMD